MRQPTITRFDDYSGDLLIGLRIPMEWAVVSDRPYFRIAKLILKKLREFRWTYR